MKAAKSKPDSIDDYGAHEVLIGDRPTAPSDFQRFDEVQKTVAEENDIRLRGKKEPAGFSSCARKSTVPAASPGTWDSADCGRSCRPGGRGRPRCPRTGSPRASTA